MTRRSYQRGAGMVSWLAVAVALATVLTLGLRLGPHYLDFRTIQAVMDGLPTEDVHSMDNRSLRELLRRRFRINNIRNLDMREVVSFERTKKATDITVKYEVREHLIMNVDAVLSFDESYNYQ